MKIRSIVFLIILSFFIPEGKLKACYWGPEAEDYRVWLFNPALSGNIDLSPFYFNTDRWNSYHVFQPENIPQENINEWSAYFSGNVKDDAIKELVYRASEEDVRQMADNKKSKNAFADYLLKNKRKDVLEYIRFAKEIQTELNFPTSWRYAEYDKSKLQALAEHAQKKARKAKDKFMQQRYAYQSIVLLRYAEKYEELIDYYQDVFGDISEEDESILKYWALAHFAFANEQTDNKREAQLNYLRSFVNCHAKKMYALRKIDDDYIKSIRAELSDADKLNVDLFLAFRTPGKSMDLLENIINLEPNHPLVKTLVVREINKIEDWLLTRKYNQTEKPAIFYWDSDDAISVNYRNDLAYTKKFVRFLEENIENKHFKDKSFWLLSVAHLYFTAEDTQKALELLDKAENAVKTNEEKMQLRYSRILIRTLAEKKYNGRFERLITDDLKYILENSESPKTDHRLSNLIFAVQQAYHFRGIHDRAALFVTFSLYSQKRWETRWKEYSSPFFYLDKHANRYQAENFLETCLSNEKTELEQILLEGFNINSDEYNELLGTMELRKGNDEKALEYYKKVNPDFWRSDNNHFKHYLSKNPFYSYKVHIRQEVEKYEKPFFNKANFVEALISKKNDFEKERNKEKKAELAFQLGNLYHNISYFGEHWYLLCYGKTVYGGEVLSTGHNTKVNENYRFCTTALDYYRQAADLQKDDYRASQYLFAAAGIKFETKKFSDDKKNSSVNVFARELKTEHPDEYKEYLEQCALLKDYLVE